MSDNENYFRGRNSSTRRHITGATADWLAHFMKIYLFSGVFRAPESARRVWTPGSACAISRKLSELARSQSADSQRPGDVFSLQKSRTPFEETRLGMSDWVKKIEAEAKGLLAEAEEELTVLEGVDTIDPLAEQDEDTPTSD